MLSNVQFFLKVIDDNTISREFPGMEGMDVKYHRCQISPGAAVSAARLIGGLLHERRRRHLAEVESRQRLTELAHLNRYSAVGELTTSIAHEINQPLGSILINAETRSQRNHEPFRRQRGNQD